MLLGLAGEGLAGRGQQQHRLRALVTGPGGSVEAPSRVRLSSAADRKELLDLLAAKGITHLGSKPVSEVVVA